MVYLTALGTDILIVNNHQAAIDLLEHMGIFFSNRPHFTMIGELCGFNRLPAISSDGASPRLRALRRALNSEIGAKTVSAYESTVEECCKVYIAKQNCSPNEFREHIQWYVLSICYGLETSSNQDPYIMLSQKIMHRLSQDAKPGKWIVDLFPLLRLLPEWFPGLSFKTYAKIIHSELNDWVTRPFELVKNQKPTTHSFCRQLMDSFEEWSPEQEDIVIWSAASMYSAGTDTTVSALSTFYLAMVHFPDVQRKAQQEIALRFPGEKGDKHCLTFRDCNELQYVHAILLEVLRWGSTLPLGAPRETTDTIIYKGYEIPPGCIVLVNIWGICHDPHLYSNPGRFCPERFLGDHPQPNPWSCVFGFGRRICPGRYLAERTLMVAIANILANFYITAVDGETPPIEYDDGFISHPKPFLCSIVPLSAH
ncbi:cytochrome P450 [Lentinula aciculospora]|uniref:Cytochrome P450 n=1 Tax=Lentinula aciculospora TaxID=153920 RepID=A0A9W9A1J5_9AGAR|nr:cytochrome P450 [Lentinula aciculospora]